MAQRKSGNSPYEGHPGANPPQQEQHKEHMVPPSQNMGKAQANRPNKSGCPQQLPLRGEPISMANLEPTQALVTPGPQTVHEKM